MIEPGFDNILNVAAVCDSTYTLGPGNRAVVWVQGCPFYCPGCMSPNLIPIRPARLVDPEKLAEELLADKEIRGITISGGEPMLQAESLAIFARRARLIREINIICFTGYQLHQLDKTPPGPGVHDFLSEIDLLVDGPYIERLNNNIGLRGSQNQQIHYLTDRLKAYRFEEFERKAEIYRDEGEALLVGIPPVKLNHAFHLAVNKVNYPRTGAAYP